jgi:hypothetical protein
MRMLVAIVALAGCYAPTYPPGGPCGAGAFCPGSLVCVNQRCVERGAVDARVPPDAAGDAAIDAASQSDAPPAVCPSDYVGLGGEPHAYKLVTTLATWDEARTACAADGTYLAIMDNAAEALAVAQATAANTWIGITDQVAEGTFVTVFGTASPFLDWAPGEPNNATLPEYPEGQDCGQLWVIMTPGAPGQLDDDFCPVPKAYACECDP